MQVESKVYVWGSGGSGQLGLGDCEDYALPQCLDAVQLDPESICSGGCHSAGMSADGRLFLWGDNEKQQLGSLKDTEARSNVLSAEVPVARLPATTRCTLVACGWWSTIAVVAEPESERGDQVYSWGANDSCQLGRGDTTTLDDRAVPARLMGFPERLRVASVACGWKHVLLVGGDGGVFSWGTGRHGQLGLGDDVLVADRPQRVAALDAAGIKRIRCGWEHSLFHAGTGEVYTCGSNRHGQLGIRSQTSAGASKKRQAVPVQVQIECNDQPATPLLAEQVDCGWHFALCILSRSEELVSWGKGSHGQLALGSFENQHLPSIIDFQHRVQQIACGSEHVLVVANGGELYSCGWGEHGNLGHGDQTNRSSLSRIEFFADKNEHVRSVAAGGAVSIAVTSSHGSS